MDSIHSLVEAYDASEGKFNVSSLKELLKELRKSKLRRPDIVFDNWMRVLNSESGNEVWNLYEQISVAALDVGDVNIANECISLLLKKFPDSSRVGRLIGMQKEQQGKYEDALEIYAELLKKNPANLMILKRRVCVFKAKGDVKREVEELNALLKQFPAESATWMELGELYLSLCDLTAAAHCLEETVLLNPVSALHHVRLADVYYSIGGFDSLVRARKHYAISLQHQSAQHNLRAVYGILYTCRLILGDTAATNSGVKDREHELRVTAEMQNWAVEQLQGFASAPANSAVHAVCTAVIS
mmetsp:Transcript_106073/g.208061  ORF Transcript_106073/g.208061 Transcript_106073/m.208061 type:complete len:300 (+) Transcript_106073:34-933(+)